MGLIQIIIAALAGMVIGALWYGPIFGKRWMKLQGISPKDVAKFKKDPKFMKSMKRSYTLSLLCQVIMALVLSFILSRLVIYNALQGAVIGLILWLGLIATTTMNKVLWERKPWALYILDISHYFVVLAVMGFILAW